MDKFSDLFVTENKNDEILSKSDIEVYLDKTSKKLPSIVVVAIKLTLKYNILTAEQLDEIKKLSKSQIDNYANKNNININDLQDLYDLLNKLKNNIRLLPQYQTLQEREAFINGKIDISDITIDLSTNDGRNKVVKLYMPIVHKIANQYIGVSKLSKSELISSALEGFAKAIKDYNKDDDNKILFKTYVSYRIQQQILNDINSTGHDLSGGNWYSHKIGAIQDAVRLGNRFEDDDEDKMLPKSLHDNPKYNLDQTRDEKEAWQELYDIIEKNFKQRDVNIFYRYFGLKGYKKELVKDIAKSFNMSNGNVKNGVINKIIAFLKNNKQASTILQDIQDIYTESLMVSVMGFSKQEIFETLINDDVYILLEELNKWRNKDTFRYALYDAIKDLDKKEVNELLSGDFESLDKNYKTHKVTIKKLLASLYPTENFNRKTDVDLINYIVELQEIYQKYNIKL